MSVPATRPRPPDPPDTPSHRIVSARRCLYPVTCAVPILVAVVIVAATALVFADTAYAAGSGHVVFLAKKTTLAGVINNLRIWLLGILAAVATLFLMVGALRYLAAGGDPGQVEKAKSALKSAAIGYGLALLAPVLITLVATLVK